MTKVALRGPSFEFQCYKILEAKRLGLLDTMNDKGVRIEGTHVAVTNEFVQGDGLRLQHTINDMPDAILVVCDRYAVTVYRPRAVVKDL